MKNLILILSAALSLNAHAQWNLKWSHTQSLSGGSFKAAPKSLLTDTSGNIYAYGNEYFEPSGDSTKGFITKYDAAGNLQWNLTLTPAVLADFPGCGLNANNLPAHICVVYNTDPSTSRLIKINPNGTIAFNIVLSGINQVSSLYGNDTTYIYVVGKAPQTACGAAMCNGIAVAKYNASGQQVWKKTKYTSGGYFTMPSQIVVDNSGNVIACGKRGVSTAPPTNNFDKTFVVKYNSAGTLQWTKEFTETTIESSRQLIDVDAEIVFGTETINTTTGIITSKLRLINSAGTVLWTKTISNSMLNGVSTAPPTNNIIMTSTGMKAYNDAGTLLWSNGFIVGINQVSTAPPTNNIIAIAKNVSTAPPTNNFLLELDEATGAVITKKDLSVNEAYMGDYGGLNWSGGTQTVNIVISDTTAPYGGMVTQVRSCSAFTYSYSASAVAVNVNNATCNNGQVTVSWSGTFNSWPQIELYNSSNVLLQVSTPPTNNYTFSNLTSGSYTVKMFDESCGEQDFSVTVKCPAPSMGLTTTNIMSTSAKANWNAPACNNTFRIQYRPVGATTWTTVSGIATPNYVINGLTSGLSYQWHIATKCNSTGAAVYSNYSAIKTFTTQSPRVGDATAEKNNNIEIKLNIYPNPANDVLALETEIENSTSLKIEIMDVTGRELISFTEQAPEGVWQREIDLSKLSKGVYILRMETGNRAIELRKFVKE